MFHYTTLKMRIGIERNSLYSSVTQNHVFRQIIFRCISLYNISIFHRIPYPNIKTFRYYIQTILDRSNVKATCKERVKYNTGCGKYMYTSAIQRPLILKMDTIKKRNTNSTSMKRRFQRNRTSFGTEQIAILERGKNLV